MRQVQGGDGCTSTEKGEGVNDPQRYREAAIRHLPALLNALPVHVLNCTAPDCGVCGVYDAILRDHAEQAERDRADEITYRKQEEVREQRERQVD
jgi:hypothetical protein